MKNTHTGKSGAAKRRAQCTRAALDSSIQACADCCPRRGVPRRFTWYFFQGFSRVMTRPAGRVRRCSKYVGSGRVRSGGVQNLTGRVWSSGVGSGRAVFKITRVTSGQVGRVGSGGFKITECLAQQLYWPATSSRIVYSSVPPVCQYHPVLYPRGIATHEINQTRVCR